MIISTQEYFVSGEIYNTTINKVLYDIIFQYHLIILKYCVDY